MITQYTIWLITVNFYGSECRMLLNQQVFINHLTPRKHGQVITFQPIGAPKTVMGINEIGTKSAHQ